MFSCLVISKQQIIFKNVLFNLYCSLIIMTDIFYTTEHKQELIAELDRLKTHDRAMVANEIESAKSHGDLSENAEYHSAREHQAKIEDRISTIEHMLNYGKTITSTDSTHVAVGHSVVVADEQSRAKKTYIIVGSEEQDISSGKISNTSPIATTLIGCAVGDIATVKTPAGEVRLEIISIS